MILCVCPNPALDRLLTLDHLTPGSVQRTGQTLVYPSGKAINVARAARTLGIPAWCTGFVGGTTGHQFKLLASTEGLQSSWTTVQGETRTDTVIVDKHGGATVLNEPGPTVTADDWARFHAETLRAAENKRVICLCGSLPPGSPQDQYIDLLQSLFLRGYPVWVDTSGAPLFAALAVNGINIKINAEEAATIFNRAIETPEAALVAAEQLRSQGAAEVILTLGKQGAALATPSGRWWVRPPLVKTVCAVGSGDAFLAGLITARLSGLDTRESIRRAAAAGAANAIMLGAGRLDYAAFEQILALTAAVEA